MADRLRVLLVGATSDDLIALRRRVEQSGVLDIADAALWSDIQTGTRTLPGDVEAALLSPRVIERRSPPPAPLPERPRLVESLTPRERDVLALVADGLSNRRIAAALDISEHTVKFHLASVFGKLGVSSRTGAIRRGLSLGLIEI